MPMPCRSADHQCLPTKVKGCSVHDQSGRPYRDRSSLDWTQSCFRYPEQTGRVPWESCPPPSWLKMVCGFVSDPPHQRGAHTLFELPMISTYFTEWTVERSADSVQKVPKDRVAQLFTRPTTTPITVTPPSPPRIGNRFGRALRAWRRYYSVYAELHERRQLRDRPWLEEFMHFGPDGRLHGQLVPPTTKGSTTQSGWCSCRPREYPG